MSDAVDDVLDIDADLFLVGDDSPEELLRYVMA